MENSLNSSSINRFVSDKSSIGIRIATTLCFYISLFLLLVRDWANAGVEADSRSSIVQGLGVIRIVFPIVAIYLLDGESRKLLLGKVSIFYGLSLLIYTFIGWQIWKNNTLFIVKDLSAFVAVYTGFALFRLIVKSYYPKLQLMALIFSCTIVIYLNLSLEAVRLKLTDVGVDRRVAEFKGSSQYNAFMDGVTGFAIGIFCRSGWFWASLLWGAVAFRTYSMLFLNARRSATLSIIILVILSLIVLSYPLFNGILSNRSSIISSSKLKLIFVGISIILLTFSFNDFNISSPFENSVLERRIFNPNDNDKLSAELRVEEVRNGIQSMQDIDWIVGRGMGASFIKPSKLLDPNSDSNLGTTFHIGIFSFLLKGGLILFAVCVYTLMMKFPFLFYQALMRPKTLDPIKRTALLSVLPGVFAWLISLLTVGHLLTIFCLPIGFTFGAYIHIRKYGLTL